MDHLRLDCDWTGRVLSKIYRLGKKSWVTEGQELPSGVWRRAPRKFFEMNMREGAIWCILRHNFEKCYSVCTDFVASRWFFRYSCLIHTVVMTIFFFFFGGGGGSWLLGGGSLYPLNTQDRTVIGVALNCSTRDCTGFEVRILTQPLISRVMTEIALDSLKHSYGAIRHISRPNSLIGQKGQL